MAAFNVPAGFAAILKNALSARGRLSAQKINGLVRPSKESVETITGAGAHIPIAYGRVSLPGIVFTPPTARDGTDLVIGVVWCMGEIYGVESVYINDEAIPSDVSARHYLGRSDQVADSWLEDAIAAYSDAMVLSKPAGDIGLAYSVFKIPASSLDAAPRIQGVLKGRKVSDPRDTGGTGPAAEFTQLSIEFTGTNGQTTGTDDSANAHALTFEANAEIQSNQLDLDGDGDLVSVADHSTLELGSDDFCIEIKATPTSIATTDYLLNKGDGTVEGLRVYKNAAAMKISLSSTGTSWDILNGVTICTLADTSEFYLVIERIGNWFIVYLNGVETYRFSSAAVLHNNSNSWKIGGMYNTYAANWDGQIRVFRLTIGSAVYKLPHTVTGTPFADSDFYPAGNIYSDNSALCLADLASNALYGMGATVSGMTAAADWCDEEIDTGVSRCRLALTLTAPRKTSDYLDLLATYADCIWYNDGDGVTIKPDKSIGADNPSGQSLVTNADFASDSDWTKGDGWTIGSGVASSDGTQAAISDLSQTLATEADMRYAVSFDITARTAGSVSVDFDGTEVIAGQSAVGSYSAIVTASDASSPLDAVATADFVGSIDNLECKRLYWLTEAVAADSVRIRGLDNDDAPTEVTVRHTEPSSSSGAWPEVSASFSLPGVDEDEAELVQTSLALPGVFRAEEGNNKAHSRLLRMKNRVHVSWVSSDSGLAHLKGEVVQLRLSYRGVDVKVWVESVSMVSYGRWKISGLRYDDEQYPGELLEPVGAGTVPVGAIVMLSGSTVPSGWSAYSTADGKFILGAGGTYAVGATGGAATLTAFSGSDTTESSHGASFTSMNKKQWYPGGGTLATVYTDTGIPNTDHSHTYDTGTLTPDLFRRENTLIEKISSSALKFPQAAMTFGLPGLSVPNMTRITSAAGRLLQAAAANANGGAASQFVSFTSGSTSAGHSHYSSSLQAAESSLSSLKWIASIKASAGGSHTHAYNLAMTRSVKKNTVALYSGTGDYSVAPGMMVLWAGSLGALPTDWQLCDGSAGTQDLRNHFIEISSEGGEDVSSGDNTISASGSGADVSHNHFTSESQAAVGSISLKHKDDHAHSHSVTLSSSWTPPYYALAMIMYNP